jgi:hypothetical protein
MVEFAFFASCKDRMILEKRSIRPAAIVGRLLTPGNQIQT